MRRILRNLPWTEYIFYCENLLNFIKNKRLLNILQLIKESHGFSHIIRRIEVSLHLLDEADRMLSKIKRERYQGESLNIELHQHFGNLIRRISISYNDIVIILSQETSSLRLSTKSMRRRQQLDQLDELIRVPPEANRVFNMFIAECLETIYGHNFRWPFTIPKPIAVSLYSDYRYLGPSKAICTHPNDVTNLCRWSTVAHELMHSKIDDVLNAYHRLAYSLSASDSNLVKENQKILEQLVEDPTEFYYKLVDLRDLFSELLKLKAGEAYRKAYSVLIEDDYYLPRYFLNLQFQEILCDIACTRIAGPAEAIVRSYTNADYCRNPELDVHDHLYDMVHPPHVVRVMYELDVLKGSQMNLSGDMMTTIEKQLYGLVGIDIFDRETTEAEDLSRYLIKVYIDTVKELLGDFSKLVDELLAEKPSFDQDRLDWICDVYVRLKRGQSPGDKVLRPFDLTNVAWLKVIDVFNRTVGEGGSYDDFVKKRENEAEFFRVLWKLALSRK